MNNQEFYQVGGALNSDSPSYIERDADRTLLKKIKNGMYCYILKYRQVGKSSLMYHCSYKLQEEGFKCIIIDLSTIGTEISCSKEWYYSFLYEIISELKLSEKKFNDYWDTHNSLTVTNLTKQIISEFILRNCNKKIVIFIDEIDYILSVRNFNRDDFFALIRSFYNLRAEDNKYNRLIFVLLGVASPNDLMQDIKRTPFNISKKIKIGQFRLEESYKLMEGLGEQKLCKEIILKRVYDWTCGTSYLMQKILNYISQNPINHISEIDTIIDKLFIQEAHSEVNIVNIQERILGNETHNTEMLYMIAKILDGQKITYDINRKTMVYLILSGLIKVENNILVYSNRIYSKIFNHTWLNNMIEKIDRPIAKDLKQWLVSNRSDEYLLRGKNLKKIEHWAKGRADLSGLELSYLHASIKREDKIKAEWLGRFFIIIIFIFAYGYINISLKITKNQEITQKQIDLKLKELKEGENPKISPYKEYNISKVLNNEYAFELLIDKSTRLNEFDKDFWYSNIDKIDNIRKDKLFNILKYYAFIDKADYLLSKDKFEEAIEYYTYATKIDCKKKKNAYIKIAEIYNSLGEHDKAIEFYNKIEFKGEDDYFKIGEIFLKKGDFNRTIEYYNRILESNPKNIKALFAKGAVYVEMNEYQKAINIYHQIIKLDSKNYEAYISIADIYFSQSNYQKAIYNYQIAIGINPIKNTIHSRDLAFKKLGKLPKNVNNFYVMGLDSIKVGNYKNAIRYLEKAIKFGKGGSKIYNVLGEAYYKIGDFEKALEILRKSNKLNRKDAKAHELMGNIYYKRKKYGMAIESYQKAIKLNLKSKDIDINLHSAYIAIFNKELISFNRIKSKWLEKSYKRYFKNKKSYFAYFKALKILEEVYKFKNIRSIEIDKWLKEYGDTPIDINYLDYLQKRWLDKIKKKVIKYKLENAFKIFKSNIPKVKYLNFFKAIKDAKEENKVVMVFIYKRGCPLCNKLEKKLDEDIEIRRVIYENFKAVRVYKNNIPMGHDLSVEDSIPAVLFFEPNNKKLIRKYSSLYDVIDILYTNLKEDVARWKKVGYIKRTLKDKTKDKHSEEGWVYLGEYKNGRWKKTNFRFDKGSSPDDIVDTFISAKIDITVRKNAGKNFKDINILEAGDEVNVKKIKRYDSYIWAKVRNIK